jgi:translation initiation factor IF-2
MTKDSSLPPSYNPQEALPSMPVRVLGLKDFPAPGDELITVKSEERAMQICQARRDQAEVQRLEEATETQVRWAGRSWSSWVSCGRDDL